MKTRIAPLLLFLILTACSFSVSTESPPSTLVPATDLPTLALPTDTPVAVAPSETAPPPSPTTAPALTATLAVSSPQPVTGIYNPYAVILVQSDDVLNVRTGAGIENAIAGTLGPAATNVNRSGPASSAGGDRWVEIQNPRGWVNANFLTEHVTSSAFCGDTRVNGLLTSLGSALLNSNGEQFASLVSPAHGLDARLWRYGTVANYTPDEAAWVFQSDYVVSWGPAPGSGAETSGTFSGQLLPKLQEVFGSTYSLHCNDTLDLATFSLQPWPAEYANINFYTVYKPGTEEFGGLDWRAWTVGIEYVGGSPKLFALIHYQWEP
jgi:hypothetical protein